MYQKILLCSLFVAALSATPLIAQGMDGRVDASTFSNIPSYDASTKKEPTSLEPIVITFDSPNSQKIIAGRSSETKQFKQVHLKKGQELLVTINDPAHCFFYDRSYVQQIGGLDCEIWYGANTFWGVAECYTKTAPYCLQAEEHLDANENQLSYHFRATNRQGTAFLYFRYTPGGMYGAELRRASVKTYLPWSAQVIVDAE